MATAKIISSHALKTRLNLFFKRAKSYDFGVEEIVRCAQSVGETAIFGGMLRDLLLYGEEGFKSDTDLVVAGDSEALQRALLKFAPTRTAYGGYRLMHKHSKIDIWCLKDTWAFQNGLVTGSGLEDLLKTTFFNWDAVAYVMGKKQLLLGENYFESIKERMLDINLEPNPNPIGTVKRAFSRVSKDSATLSPRLVDYVGRVLASPEGKAWGLKTASKDELFLTFYSSFHVHIEKSPASPFELNPQLTLWDPLRHVA